MFLSKKPHTIVSTHLKSMLNSDIAANDPSEFSKLRDYITLEPAPRAVEAVRFIRKNLIRNGKRKQIRLLVILDAWCKNAVREHVDALNDVRLCNRVKWVATRAFRSEVGAGSEGLGIGIVGAGSVSRVIVSIGIGSTGIVSTGIIPARSVTERTVLASNAAMRNIRSRVVKRTAFWRLYCCVDGSRKFKLFGPDGDNLIGLEGILVALRGVSQSSVLMHNVNRNQ
ncbi:hypothetical protein K470DRAFT_294882 [Piedraia hortae CBS 480.64]|uniref:Uncharacterized protein n=1 Tax=Piedraia hortae CBS 480.64 TaxID=1314780 RepID=A0A6A7BZL6_9PEZI|nr:hypothetical protein K470DRAFT_294882 [Piedraia hortae CBS 480.64]